MQLFILYIHFSFGFRISSRVLVGLFSIKSLFLSCLGWFILIYYSPKIIFSQIRPVHHNYFRYIVFQGCRVVGS